MTTINGGLCLVPSCCVRLAGEFQMFREFVPSKLVVVHFVSLLVDKQSRVDYTGCSN